MVPERSIDGENAILVQVRLVLLAVLSSCAFAQSIPPDRQIQRLLQSQNPRDKAWGAWYAGTSHNAALLTPVLDQLKAAESLIGTQQGTDEQALIQTLLDAAIQIPGPVANDVVLPFLNDWKPEVLILLSRRPADADTEEALLDIRERPMSEAEWVAVNDLLYAGHSKYFFQRILGEIQFTHAFIVSEEHGLNADGGSSGCAISRRSFVKGFPPAAAYQLLTFIVAPGDILFEKDPVAVYYRRSVYRPDSEIEWTDCQFYPASAARQDHLGLFLAAIDDLSPMEAISRFHADTWLWWQGSVQQVTTEIGTRLAEQTAAIHTMVEHMKQRGQLPPDGIPLTIKVSVRDYRRDRSVPLQGLGTREIAVP